MRFPKFSELDHDQRAVYSGAPPEDSILVTGPPGTGKTVVAFHRAETLQKLAERKKMSSLTPRVIMYNRVLSRYTNNRGEVARNVEVSTMHKWFYSWWKRVTNTSPPSLNGDSYEFDWHEILRRFASVRSPEKAHWGHLVIDEGQDFQQEMYSVLAIIAGIIGPAPDGKTPAITVFADDNQRIDDRHNSTTADIARHLALPPTGPKRRIYRLSRNYRNSRPIAKFAANYYVGLPSGIPDLPDRAGTKPIVLHATGLEAIRRRIATYANNHPGTDIGVFCLRNAMRKQVYNRLLSRLAGSKMKVQTYANNESKIHPPEALSFDAGGTVTVLNSKSVKGLEFDAVFIIEPFSSGTGATQEHQKMQMYVMCSRAKHHLELMILSDVPQLLCMLPEKSLYETIRE